MTDRGDGCAYLIDDQAGQHQCAEPLRPDSPYCPHHHGITHLTRGTRQEIAGLKWFEFLANARAFFPKAGL